MRGRDPKDYYRVLGLDVSASEDEIKMAFRAKAKRLHPDHNPDPAAAKQFDLLLDAYQILSDPEQRATYDKLTSEEPRATDEPAKIDPVPCSACGVVSAQARVIRFDTVSSLFIYSKREFTQKVYCHNCSAKAAWKANLHTAVLGWWAVPFGPLLTVGTILKNAAGGKFPKEENDQLKWFNLLAFHGRRRTDLAIGLAHQLRGAEDFDLSLKAEQYLSQARKHGHETGAASKFKSVWSFPYQEFVAQSAICIGIPMLAAFLAFGVIFGRPQSSPLTADLRSHGTFLKQTGTASSSPRASRSPSAAASDPPSPAPIATATPSRVNSVEYCPFPPTNGQILGGYGDSQRRLHRLEVHNGTRDDAIVKVRAPSGRVFASFFVQKGERASIGHVADGTYNVQFAFGSRLDSKCQNFAPLKSASAFPTPETFQVKRTSSTISYQVLSVTLHAVSGGNARTTEIPTSSFNAD